MGYFAICKDTEGNTFAIWEINGRNVTDGSFAEPDAWAKWLSPNGFTCKVHSLDAKVGGGYKMSFTNFTTGKK